MHESEKTFTQMFDSAIDGLMQQFKNKDPRYMAGFVDGYKYYLDYNIRVLQETKKILEGDING